MKPRSFSSRYIFLLLAAILWILAGFGCGGAAPAATEAPAEATAAPAATEAPVPTDEVSATQAPVITVLPAIKESRRLTLEFPPQMRAGDSDLIRLTLEVDDLGNITPTAETGGNVITGETIEIPNLYETHHVIAEARFDMAGVEISPPDLSSQTLAQGQSVTFYWSIRPGETGVYRGTVWLYLRFVDKQNGQESRKAVSAQLVEIEAVNLLGLSANFARATGVIGSVVGTVIGFPFFDDILKFLVKRRKKRGQ